MKHNGNTAHGLEARRLGGRRSKPVAATVRSQADSSSGSQSNPAAQPSADPSRDLTVATTRATGRAGARRSSRTRIGKIARLPKEVREQLNRRLQDGEPGETLLDWLNALPKVQKILAAQFGGRPISKQNLSEWKQGGYRDWERAEEDRLRVERITKQAAQLGASEEESPLSERLAAVLLVELAGTFEELKDESPPLSERWQCLRQMLREVAQVRREDNRAARLRIEKERWEWEADRLEHEVQLQSAKEAKEKLCAPYTAAMNLPVLAQMFGGGEMGRKFAADMLEIKHELAPGTLGGRRPSDPVKPGPAKLAARKGRPKRKGRSGRIDEASQAESNPVKAAQANGAEETLRQDAGGPDPVNPDQASRT